ncbi:MAG TPA: hypothetical protein VF299_10545 [Mycobacterium sp.]
MSRPDIDRLVRQQRADIEALYELVEGVDHKVDALDVKLSAKVDALGGRVGAVDGKVYALGGRVGAVDGKVDALGRRVGALDAKFDRRFDEVSGQLTEVVRQLGGR